MVDVTRLDYTDRVTTTTERSIMHIPRKLAVIPALLIGCLALASVASATSDYDHPDHKVHICHHDNGKPEWKNIEISESALAAHLAHQWGADIYPVPENGCPVPETTTTVSETTVPATTVPESIPPTTVAPVTTEAPTVTDPATTAPADPIVTVPDPVVPIPPSTIIQATDIPPVPATALPRTGRNTVGLLVAAFLLVLIGAACMWLNRRPRNV